MSWIAMADEIAAIKFALTNDNLAGPVNLTAPNPVTNADLTKSLARALHRPAFAAVPPFALRLAFGGFADEGLLAGQRVLPNALQEAGYSFVYDDLDSALAAMLATSRGPSRTGPTRGMR
jgi:NAD dependent epimerase/dehydratase family enzyme